MSGSPWRRFVIDLVESLTPLGTDDGTPAHGGRVGDLALALADAAARSPRSIDGLPLDDDARDSIRVAARLHGLVDAAGGPSEPRAGRLSVQAMASIEYRLRWIREICRHRAMIRSVLDGGGFYPPADPSGMAAMDYALRASEVEDILEFLDRVNRFGPAGSEDRERLGAIARRTLDTGDGPAVPYLTETEHASLARAAELRRADREQRFRRSAEELLVRLGEVPWPPALSSVPLLLEALFFGAGPEAPLTARLLAVAESWDRLLRRGGREGEGLAEDQVLMRLRREAEMGRLDRTLVAALEASGLLPRPTADSGKPSEDGPSRGEPLAVH